MERRLRRSSPPVDLDEDDRRLWQTAYEFALSEGAPEPIARKAADMAILDLPVEAGRMADLFERFERMLQSKEPETLSLKWQLFMWNYEDPEGRARIQAMQQTGKSVEEITLAIFPLRWDLIRRGRRKPEDQVKFAERLAAIAEVVRQTRADSSSPSDEYAEIVPKRGRPKGSGTFSTPREFRKAISSAIVHLRGNGQTPTLANVAQFFTQSSEPSHPRCDERQLRRWFQDQFGYPRWEDVLDDVVQEIERQN